VHLKDGAYSLFNAAERRAEAVAAAGQTAVAGGQASPRPKAVAVQRALQTLEMEVSQIMKGGFDHYMQASKVSATYNQQQAGQLAGRSATCCCARATCLRLARRDLL